MGIISWFQLWRRCLRTSAIAYSAIAYIGHCLYTSANRSAIAYSVDFHDINAELFEF